MPIPEFASYDLVMLEALGMIPIMAIVAYWGIRRTVQAFKR
jgi:hypothetical protein